MKGDLCESDVSQWLNIIVHGRWEGEPLLYSTLVPPSGTEMQLRQCHKNCILLSGMIELTLPTLHYRSTVIILAPECVFVETLLMNMKFCFWKNVVTSIKFSTLDQCGASGLTTDREKKLNHPVFWGQFKGKQNRVKERLCSKSAKVENMWCVVNMVCCKFGLKLPSRG